VKEKNAKSLVLTSKTR